MISDPNRAYREIAGLNENRTVGAFDAAQGYLSRGDEHISEDDIKPVNYTTGFERGYSAYFRYLDMLFASARAAGVHVYEYRFPWPEQRAADPACMEVELLGDVEITRYRKCHIHGRAPILADREFHRPPASEPPGGYSA
jgi:hypothetical protein